MEILFQKKKLPGFAIITGSSRGLGANFAYRLASEGYDIVLNYSNPASTDDAQQIIRQIQADFGRSPVVVPGDISDPAACKMIVDAGIKAFGSEIAVLINNAGIHKGGPFEDAAPEDYTRILYVDLIGTVNMCQAVLPYMKKQCSGAIINISSSAAYAQSYKNEAYGTAKAAVLGLTKCLALELAPYKVRVNAIAPCQHETKMVADFAKAQPENFKKSCSEIPLGRIGRREELSEAMSYLVHAEFMTGHCIAHTGGKVLLS